jgi:hypothetical protein
MKAHGDIIASQVPAILLLLGWLQAPSQTPLKYALSVMAAAVDTMRIVMVQVAGEAVVAFCLIRRPLYKHFGRRLIPACRVVARTGLLRLAIQSLWGSKRKVVALAGVTATLKVGVVAVAVAAAVAIAAGEALRETKAVMVVGIRPAPVAAALAVLVLPVILAVEALAAHRLHGERGLLVAVGAEVISMEQAKDLMRGNMAAVGAAMIMTTTRVGLNLAVLAKAVLFYLDTNTGKGL